MLARGVPAGDNGRTVAETDKRWMRANRRAVYFTGAEITEPSPSQSRETEAMHSNRSKTWRFGATCLTALLVWQSVGQVLVGGRAADQQGVDAQPDAAVGASAGVVAWAARAAPHARTILQSVGYQLGQPVSIAGSRPAWAMPGRPSCSPGGPIERWETWPATACRRTSSSRSLR